MTLKNHIGLNIRLYRRLKGLTQEELAIQAGMHVNTIIQLEDLRRKANPRVETLERLGRVLRVKVCYI